MQEGEWGFFPQADTIQLTLQILIYQFLFMFSFTKQPIAHCEFRIFIVYYKLKKQKEPSL